MKKKMKKKISRKIKFGMGATFNYLLYFTRKSEENRKLRKPSKSKWRIGICWDIESQRKAVNETANA